MIGERYQAGITTGWFPYDVYKLRDYYGNRVGVFYPLISMGAYSRSSDDRDYVYFKYNNEQEYIVSFKDFIPSFEKKKQMNRCKVFKEDKSWTYIKAKQGLVMTEDNEVLAILCKKGFHVREVGKYTRLYIAHEFATNELYKKFYNKFYKEIVVPFISKGVEIAYKSIYEIEEEIYNIRTPLPVKDVKDIDNYLNTVTTKKLFGLDDEDYFSTFADGFKPTSDFGILTDIYVTINSLVRTVIEEQIISQSEITPELEEEMNALIQEGIL